MIEAGIKSQIAELKVNLRELNKSIGRGEWRKKWYDAANITYQAKKPGAGILSTRVFSLMVNGHYISDDNLSLATSVYEKGIALVEEKKQLIEKATKK